MDLLFVQYSSDLMCFLELLNILSPVRSNDGKCTISGWRKQSLIMAFQCVCWNVVIKCIQLYLLKPPKFLFKVVIEGLRIRLG